MKVPHPIPYQGSKRNIARFILRFFPREINRLIEPFAGSAAVSIAAACYGKAHRFHLNDINGPLMGLWQEIIHQPGRLANNYEQLWQAQQGREREFYDYVRDEFNRTSKPEYLLYLLARCVKASVRYNARGEFNQSPDNRRLGRHPKQMAEDILAVSDLLCGETIITSKDYSEVLARATPSDLVYLDPPYQGVCTGSDPRYYKGMDFETFMLPLEHLNYRGVPFMLSYDGRTGQKSFGRSLPAELELYRLEIEAGRSSQSTLLGRNELTFESIYLSRALLDRLEFSPAELAERGTAAKPVQLEMAIG